MKRRLYLSCDGLYGVQSRIEAAKFRSALKSGLDSKVDSSLILDIADMSFSASVRNEVTMLAYGFWHAPYFDIDVSEYENALPAS